MPLRCGIWCLAVIAAVVGVVGGPLIDPILSALRLEPGEPTAARAEVGTSRRGGWVSPMTTSCHGMERLEPGEPGEPTTARAEVGTSRAARRAAGGCHR